MRIFEISSSRMSSRKKSILRFVIFLSVSTISISILFTFMLKKDSNLKANFLQNEQQPNRPRNTRKINDNQKTILLSQRNPPSPTPPIVMTKRNCDFPVDIVYTWVNGSEKEWSDRKNKIERKDRVRVSRSTEKSRYIDIGELMFNLRGIEKNIPWFRRIFIITDNQIPNWIRLDHPNLTFVNHTDIIPQEFLPVYNSNNIEFHMHNIPGLSEHFIYLNDDVFIARPLNKTDFFTENGIPIIPVCEYDWIAFRNETEKYLDRKSLRNDMGSVQYRLTSARSFEVYYTKFRKAVNYRSIHGYMTFTKTLMKYMWDNFPMEIGEVEKHKFRDYTDVNIPSLSIFCGIGSGLAVPILNDNINHLLSLDSMFQVKLIDFNYTNYRSFCLNSGERTTNHVRKAAKAFLNNYMPNKSSFEK
ncbi:Capsular polysaccharide phosphotransferase fcs1 [Tritrichomonas foetus]|uniref:Capsular polysaccharide phosphotransferase fcs1 n=1 Tax=Tritrichomonas foetus TaxID=1144522 RepID=A0A1J4JEU7_9EUKA|nr:Capsular polysaccharide phosphotransferase fcs1 [Tritrichomonas foetus]|eukprot:OHS96171.1 Capsular polysaccharide phosphotransferase fcs1 [Tritrichomonas foetus]